ncbi:hypothetical protein GWK47_038033 [Chionoecetes opilio]|uniref:Uncharacterized protein n=1 Tax=Chionoecetes opilio TaxID=41210 RepID=A0A8J4YLA4_CHIOP|nr:hypothetical protein GWK47_038033 [Chionoecetes opilio]
MQLTGTNTPFSWEGRKIPLQESVNILGVEFDSASIHPSVGRSPGCCLETELHPTRRAPPGRSGSRLTLQPLAWSSCPLSYLRLLDRVQARAKRLARLKAPEAAAQIIQPLQQRRDVAGMCVMYKAHRVQTFPQLAELGPQPTDQALPLYPCGPQHRHQVTVPFARTEHYLRSFLPRYGRLWNTLVRQTDLHLTTSMHAFKSGVNAWLQAELTQ